MAIDTPARLAILGAGPLGLEAALYARFLGYDVIVIEAGEVAEHVKRWGHLQMFSRFGHCRSPLGLAALAAQDEAYEPPADEARLTGREWREHYLLPLSATDLLVDHIRPHTRVVAVGKEVVWKGDLPGHPDRGDWSFRILVREADGKERIEMVDGVIDATGVIGTSNYLGHGGIPAVGELALAGEIDYQWPDIRGADRARFAARHTLVVGGGASAATHVVALAELAREAAGTRVTWITRREGPAGTKGPLACDDNDPLAARQELFRAANQLAVSPDSPVTYWPATLVERISRDDPAGPLVVELSGMHAGDQRFDRIIANVGFRPDWTFSRELQWSAHSVTDEPHSTILGTAGDDNGAAILQPEPNYHVLGAKSYGRRANFCFTDGLNQIRRLFQILGDRETLDLYATVKLPK
jgi:cation diffusion facilitator CzcD-associated flavoprotein CzcO